MLGGGDNRHTMIGGPALEVFLFVYVSLSLNKQSLQRDPFAGPAGTSTKPRRQRTGRNRVAGSEPDHTATLL